jgi:hexokinase
LKQNFVDLFQQALDQIADEYQMKIVACVDESVAALISVAFEHPNTLIALIFGHTCRLSFVEEIETLRIRTQNRTVSSKALFLTVLPFRFDSSSSRVSMKSHALFQTLLTSIDAQIMQQDHMHYFDVFTCDRCLLESIRLIWLELCIHHELLPYSIWSRSQLNRHGSISIDLLSYLLRGKHRKVKPHLQQIGLEAIKRKDLFYMRYVCHLIIRRATQILSCLIVAVADRYKQENITVAIDSYLYRLCPIYQIYLNNEIQCLCKRWITTFHFVVPLHKSYVIQLLQATTQQPGLSPSGRIS